MVCGPQEHGPTSTVGGVRPRWWTVVGHLWIFRAQRGPWCPRHSGSTVSEAPQGGPARRTSFRGAITRRREGRDIHPGREGSISRGVLLAYDGVAVSNFIGDKF